MAVLGLAALIVHSNSEICATQPAGALTTTTSDVTGWDDGYTGPY
jgi:hypothetical protein